MVPQSAESPQSQVSEEELFFYDDGEEEIAYEDLEEDELAYDDEDTLEVQEIVFEDDMDNESESDAESEE